MYIIISELAFPTGDTVVLLAYFLYVSLSFLYCQFLLEIGVCNRNIFVQKFDAVRSAKQSPKSTSDVFDPRSTSDMSSRDTVTPIDMNQAHRPFGPRTPDMKSTLNALLCDENRERWKMVTNVVSTYGNITPTDPTSGKEIGPDLSELPERRWTATLNNQQYRRYFGRREYKMIYDHFFNPDTIFSAWESEDGTALRRADGTVCIKTNRQPARRAMFVEPSSRW